MTRVVVRGLGLVFSGLFAGFLLGILVLELSLRQFDGVVYAHTQQAALIGLPALASALLLPALITNILLAVLTRRSRNGAFWLTTVAALLLLTAFVVTLAINVPINLSEGAWDPSSPPADWAALRDRWQIGHAIRTVVAVAAFGVLAIAAAVPRRVAVAEVPRSEAAGAS